ncbi:MAG TPA: N-acetylmuramic acid 6-phosphate etherase, partial [Saprospiraceae bacterium]|nr:N-acetylmuramic acid 6-phosphate etherase [Saprospiraceae bacterium]
MKKVTESPSLYDHLEQKSITEILTDINREDKKVADVVETCIPQIEALVNAIVPKLRDGGRLFYIGAGTSGRLGILDASECPPTFGVSPDMVIG